jgi:3-deoxy-7-phosphoheptulonate synthase
MGLNIYYFLTPGRLHDKIRTRKMIRRPELVLLKKKGQKTHFPYGKKQFGRDFIIIAGPCSVESEQHFLKTARRLKAIGVDGLRGGAFKPRTSPYDFQGLGLDGLKILAAAREETGLPVVTEIMDTRHVELGCQYADMIQIGSRNMHNYSLLKEVAKCAKPVLLKRGMQATLMEWLNAAEYILAGGNAHVVLCERGIRTFELATRFSLDLSIVPATKELTHLPIIVDPSHGTGKASLVRSMALASVAAGADGVMIEVHPHPEKALTDKEQQYPLALFPPLVKNIRRLCQVLSSFVD